MIVGCFFLIGLFIFVISFGISNGLKKIGRIDSDTFESLQFASVLIGMTWIFSVPLIILAYISFLIFLMSEKLCISFLSEKKEISQRSIDKLHKLALKKTYIDTGVSLDCSDMFWYEQGLIDGYKIKHNLDEDDNTESE